MDTNARMLERPPPVTGESESARLIREVGARLRQELVRRDDEVAELRRQLATTRAYIGILS